jgi:hypothetical protein
MTAPTTFTDNTRIVSKNLNGGEPFTLSVSDLNEGTSTSTSYTIALTGAAVLSIDFVVPPSGKVIAIVGGTMSAAVSANVYLSVQVTSLDSLTTYFSPSDTDSLHVFSNNLFKCGCRKILISGLTPGAARTAWLAFKVSGSTGHWRERSLIVKYTN